jgi:essential nuclear protein 1
MRRKVKSVGIQKRDDGHQRARGHQRPLPEQLASAGSCLDTDWKRQQTAEKPSSWQQVYENEKSDKTCGELLDDGTEIDFSQAPVTENGRVRSLRLAAQQQWEAQSYDDDFWGHVAVQQPQTSTGEYKLNRGWESVSEDADSLNDDDSASSLSTGFLGADSVDGGRAQLAETSFPKITEDEEVALAALGRGEFDSSSTFNLADLVAAKLRERDDCSLDPTLVARDETDKVQKSMLDGRVCRLYESVGEIMHRYRSGKIPKAFKLMPALREWEEAMWLTRPERWSPQAVLVATRAFASHLDPDATQRFYTAVLLPRCREDIATRGKLNAHLYRALRKSTYKPQAFYKGILFPLIAENCTLREAAVFCSVLNRSRIPVLHSAAALLYLARMSYSGPVALFIRVLLDKQYALPYRVVDALLDHFLRAREDPQEYPVLWHQSLLAFVQYFKSEFSAHQRESLRSLIREKHHHAITPAIYRELQSVRSRNSEIELSEISSSNKAATIRLQG